MEDHRRRYLQACCPEVVVGIRDEERICQLIKGDYVISTLNDFGKVPHRVIGGSPC